MRPTKSWSILFFLLSASAASDAPVYIFDGVAATLASNLPTLTPDQASLVFAQRLGFSNRHSLKDATENTLSYINSFGNHQETLFIDDRQPEGAALLVVVDGASTEGTLLLLEAWPDSPPTFTISQPSSFAGKVLVLGQEVPKSKARSTCDLLDDINPSSDKCWNGSSKVIHYDLTCDADDSKLQKLIAAQDHLKKFVDLGQLSLAVVFLPGSSSSSVECVSKAEQSKKLTSQNHLGRRQMAEEPIPSHTATDSLVFGAKQVAASTSPKSDPITDVPARCHSSLDSCISATNNCSGHGECYKKSGSKGDASRACYTCGCVPQNVTYKLDNARTGSNVIYWGGAACQKKDVSGPFWLIAIFSVVMVGLVSWAIGLLYSIGEEKLPGVIGAGVSSKAR